MRDSLSQTLRSIVTSAALLLFLCMFNMPLAYAADFDVEIPGGTREGDPGTLHTLATQPVDPEFQGRQCGVIAVAVNQHSVHPNSDLLVRSGGTEVVVRDVEAAPNVTVEGEGTLILGEEIVVVVRFGEDGIFSGAMTVTLDCPEMGRIVVVKEVTEGSNTSQEFGFDASYLPDGFSLSDGEQHDSGPLPAGEYSLSENVPEGWELESAVCDDSNSPLPEINLLAGETVTCVFTNDELPAPEMGRIVVVKEVTEGSNTSQEFGFDASYLPDGFSLSDGEQHDSGPLPAGEYSLSENVPEGWELESAVCDDSNSPLPEINLLAGETVTCVFTNDELPDGEVGAAIVVTVEGKCEVLGGEPVGELTVSIPVAGGAEIVVRDSHGDVVGTFTEDASVEVPEGQYTWEATAGPGFEFPEGFQSSGSVTVLCAQVGASILITVNGACELVGNQGVGRITVTMSVGDAANVVVRDSSGESVGSLSADGTLTVPEGDQYTWEATLAEGFELASGQPDSGTLNIPTCSPVAVLPVEVLPFTGLDTHGMGTAGLIMVAMGGVTLLVSRRIRQDS